MICKHCGRTLKKVDGQWIDVDINDACCESYYDDCPACQDGEPHPHEAVRA